MRDGHAWVDYYRRGEGHHWMEVAENGEVLYLRLGMGNTVEDARRGTLSATDAADIFGLLRSIGFFTMASADPFAQGIVYEGDSLSVFACSRDQCHRVGARPPRSVPQGLADFVRVLEDKIPALRSEPGVTEEQVKGRPALSAAIGTPGRFVLLDSQQLDQLRDVLPDRRSAFVSTPTPFQLK